MTSFETEAQGRIVLPDVVTMQWAKAFGEELEKTSWRGAGALRDAMSFDTVLKILHKAAVLLKAEPTLLEVIIPGLSKQLLTTELSRRLSGIYSRTSPFLIHNAYEVEASSSEP